MTVSSIINNYNNMATLGSVLLIIFAVAFAFALIYGIVYWGFYQLVKRPFLNGTVQPDLTINGWYKQCPPLWPLALSPIDPEKRLLWIYKWKLYGGCWLVFFLWSLTLGISNSVTTTSDEGNNNFFVMLAYAEMGMIIVLPWCVGLCDALTACFFALQHWNKKPLPNTRKNWELERWGLIIMLWVVFTLIGLNTGYQWGRDSPAVKTLEIPLERLPACMDKLRVVLLTDIHTGPNVSKGFVEEMVQVTNDLQPELVLHVGDGGDGRPVNIGKFNMPLASLTCPNRYFVTGNHEYLHGNGGSGKPWEDFYQNEAGFTVLHNEAVKITSAELPGRTCGAGDSLTLVGVPDAMSGDMDLDMALTSVSPGEEWILLSHQPNLFPKAMDQAADKHVGLQVSGHIHAGQCFPMHPIIYITSNGLFSGLIQKSKSFIFVANGNANWGTRVRLFSSPHNTLLVLRHADTFRSEGRTVDLTSTKETNWAIAGLVLLPLYGLSQLAVYLMERNAWGAWWKVGYQAENSVIADSDTAVLDGEDGVEMVQTVGGEKDTAIEI